MRWHQAYHYENIENISEINEWRKIAMASNVKAKAAAWRNKVTAAES